VRAALLCLCLSVPWSFSGCAQPDLGFSPFLCNPGQPECPDGYTCVQRGSQRRCEKEGVEPPAADAAVDTRSLVDASVNDWPQLPDRGRRDAPKVVDRAVPVDQPRPVEGTHLGCQDNNECNSSDPTNPCCCPFFGIWVCQPVCFNPICF
jgi:hypothetical protein